MRPSRGSRAALPLIVAFMTAAGCAPAASTAADPSGSAPATRASGPSASTPAATGDPASSPPVLDLRDLRLSLETVADGFDRPLAAVNAGDGSDRLFVVEQGGRVLVVRDGELADEPFLDVGERIIAGGERGLLGLAFHPRFPDDPRLFVDYTADGDGANTVSSFRVPTADADQVDPASEEVLVAIDDPFGNHNGGSLAFGPDGLLYIATGDGGSAGDPQDNGQNTDALLGKILRIDVDGRSGNRPYGIPTDNPFAADGGRPEVWLYGLRNPWRMSFDRQTGDLWIGDVGQGAWEEIDVHRAGTEGGVNFGWARMEGAHCFPAVAGCDRDAFARPVAEYGHDAGCTVIGGYVYRGAGQPALAGAYLFADYCSGNVWALDPAGPEPQQATLVAESERAISSFGEDESGELYATDLATGDLLRVVGSR